MIKKRRNIKQTGEIERIGTLFPNQKINEIRNGMVIVKLKTLKFGNGNESNKYNINMEIKYEDRNGNIYENNQCIILNVNDSEISNNNHDYFDDIEIRKGILLCRYIRLLKQWITEDIDSNHMRRSFLNVWNKWKNMFSNFIIYFESEMDIINDNNLQKEINLLNKLVSYNAHNKIEQTQNNTNKFQLDSVTDLIISFLELKDPRITWKMIEFLSNEPTTNILMSFLSRINNNAKIIPVIDISYSNDPNEIRLTQLSYSLMKILSNDNYTETVVSFQ